MARPLELPSNVLQMTHAHDALRAVADETGAEREIAVDLVVTLAMGIATLTAGAMTLPRCTP